MRHLTWVMLICFVPATVFAGNPKKEIQVKDRAIVYAFEPLRWSLSAPEIERLDPAEYECKGPVCLFTVKACKPLYRVPSDIPGQEDDDGWIAVLPLNNHPTDSGIPTAGPITGPLQWKPLPRRAWTFSKDECLAKIRKQQSQSPEKSYENPPEKPPGN